MYNQDKPAGKSPSRDPDSGQHLLSPGYIELLLSGQLLLQEEPLYFEEHLAGGEGGLVAFDREGQAGRGVGLQKVLELGLL